MHWGAARAAVDRGWNALVFDGPGQFADGGVLINRDNRLESVRGYYYANTKDLVCVDRVEMRNDEYELKGDSVVYNMATGQMQSGGDGTRVHTVIQPKNKTAAPAPQGR